MNVNDFGHVQVQEELKIHNYFDGIEDVHMKSLKVYYLLPKYIVRISMTMTATRLNVAL